MIFKINLLLIDYMMNGIHHFVYLLCLFELQLLTGLHHFLIQVIEHSADIPF